MRPSDKPTRRGVGSIIGGVFLVLIFTSMITSYVFIENAKRSTDEKYLERYEFQNNKLQEDVSYLSVTKKANDYLNITVTNSGHVGTEIVYVGEFNETDPLPEDIYHRIDLFLNPTETATDIASDLIRVAANETKRLLLLTSYGNSYVYSYSDVSQNGSGTYYDLTISVTGTGTTSPSVGVHSYLANSSVDVTANHGGGWSFSHWILDGVPTGGVNPISVTMGSNHSLEARFVQTIVLLIDYFDNFTKWDATNWEIQSDQYYSANTSARSDSNNERNLQCNALNSSNGVSLNIVFWYRLAGGIDANDVAVQLYDGGGGPDTIDHLDGVEDTWRLYNYTTTDSQYFIPDFYINFDSNLGGGEMVWIDDMIITLVR